jgi:hypothetical protein
MEERIIVQMITMNVIRKEYEEIVSLLKKQKHLYIYEDPQKDGTYPAFLFNKKAGYKIGISQNSMADIIELKIPIECFLDIRDFSGFTIVEKDEISPIKESDIYLGKPFYYEIIKRIGIQFKSTVWTIELHRHEDDGIVYPYWKDHITNFDFEKEDPIKFLEYTLRNGYLIDYDRLERKIEELELEIERSSFFIDAFRKKRQFYIERKYNSEDCLLYINGGIEFHEKRLALLSQDLEDLMLLSQDLKDLRDSIED